jgi:hypothetical protein
VPTRAARPYQGRADADPKGIVPGVGLEPACACFKGRLGCCQPTPERTGAPARCHPWLAGLTKAARSLEPGASTLGGTRTRNHMALNHARLPVCGTSACEPPPGADPGHPPYEGGAAAVRGGKATLPGFEPGTSWFRAKRCCRLS